MEVLSEIIFCILKNKALRQFDGIRKSSTLSISLSMGEFKLETNYFYDLLECETFG